MGLPKPRTGLGSSAPSVEAPSPSAAPKATDLLAFRPDPSLMPRPDGPPRAPAPRDGEREIETCHNPAEVRLTDAAARRPALLEPAALALLKRACRRLRPKGWPELVERFQAALKAALHHRPRRWDNRDRRLAGAWALAPWYRLDPRRFAAPAPPAQPNLRTAARGLPYLTDLGFENVRLAPPSLPGPALSELIAKAHALGLRVIAPLAPAAPGEDPLAALGPLTRALHDGALGFVFTPPPGVEFAPLQEHLTILKLFACALCPPAVVFVEDDRPELGARWVGGALGAGSSGADFVPCPEVHEATPELLYGAQPELTWRGGPEAALARLLEARGVLVVEGGAELGRLEGPYDVARLGRASLAGPDTTVGFLRAALRQRRGRAPDRSR